jgi:membrane associated rhomboid family serine protease
MRRSFWSLALAVLAFGGLAMLGGTALGGDLGPLLGAYGLLFGLCGLYMVLGLALRDRVRDRLSRQDPTGVPTDRLAGRRIF